MKLVSYIDTFFQLVKLRKRGQFAYTVVLRSESIFATSVSSILIPYSLEKKSL